MRETVVLWWRLRAYRPPTPAAQTRRPHAGDALLGGISAVGLGALAGFIRRRTGRR